MDGFNWGIGGFGLGNISSYTSEIEICETNQPTDYKLVSDQIRKNEQVVISTREDTSFPGYFQDVSGNISFVKPRIPLFMSSR